MRKSELLKYIPKKLPKTVKTVKTFISDHRRVLMVIDTNPHPGAWQPVVRKGAIIHFLDKKTFLTYRYDLVEWTKEAFYTTSGSGATAKLDEESQKALNKFFNSKNARLWEVVSAEDSINEKKKLRAWNNKMKRIENRLSDTPNLPEGFKGKITRILKESREKEVKVTLYQELKNGRTMERMFSVYERLNGGIQICEILRAYKDEHAGRWSEWYYGIYGHRYGRHQKFIDKKGLSVINNKPRRAYIYDNLDSLDMDPAGKSCLRIMSGMVDPTFLLLSLTDDLEKVIKAGLTRLAKETVDNRWNIDKLQKLKSRKDIEKLKAANGGTYAVELLAAAPNITEENLKEFCKIKEYDKAHQIISLAEKYNINHLFTLWKQTGGIKKDVIRDYRDYLGMAEQLGHDTHEEIIYRNKRWQEFHAMYVAELEKVKDKQVNKKYKGISRDYKRNMKIFGWQHGGYIITVPAKASEINDEGRRQHHCVGSSETYKQKMDKRESYIVFLRHADDPKKPYYTIECTETSVIQFYAAYDRQPNRAEVQKILSQWMKQVKKNVRAEKKAV